MKQWHNQSIGGLKKKKVTSWNETQIFGELSWKENKGGGGFVLRMKTPLCGNCFMLRGEWGAVF